MTPKKALSFGLPSTDKTVKSTKFFVLFAIHRFHFPLSSFLVLYMFFIFLSTRYMHKTTFGFYTL